MLGGRRIDVVILGSSGGVPTESRMLPAVAVRDWMGHVVLLDAGEGVQLRLRQAGISLADIDVVALTHSHGDHVNGLPGLLQSMHMAGRSRPLIIVADRHTARFAREALEVEGDLLRFNVNLVEASGSGHIEFGGSGGDRLILEWFPVCHTVEAYGFRLSWRLRPRLDPERLAKLGLRGPLVSELLRRGELRLPHGRVRLEDVGRPGGSWSLVYTGDTAPCRSVVEASRGAGLLVHDSSFDSSLAREAWERGHSTSLDAARAAAEAGVGVLVLTHISARYRGLEARRLEVEARRVFPRSVLAWDLMRLTFSA